MFRLLLAGLFTLALVSQAVAQDNKDVKKDEAPKVEDKDTNTILKEIRDELRKSNEPKVVDFYSTQLSWGERIAMVGERVTNIAPIILLVLIAVVLIGMRSDMNEAAQKMIKKE